MRHFGLALLCLAVSASTAFAENTPRRGPNDSRVRIATYVDQQVYRLN